MALPAKAAAGKEKLTVRISRYFRSVIAELKKVHWSTRQELVTYTTVVLAAVFLVALVVWLVDSLFSFILGFIM